PQQVRPKLLTPVFGTDEAMTTAIAAKGRGTPSAAEFQSQGAIMSVKKEVFRRNGVTPNMLTTAFLLTMLVPAVVSAQQKPTTGYAPVNGVKMYYEVHGSGEPVVLLHGAFMTITNNWTDWIGELSKTRNVLP